MEHSTCFGARRRVFPFSLLALLLGAGPAVEAQQRLEEVIVTAQRREENVQNVPIAMSVVTGETLDVRSVTQVAQVADFSPNVYMDATVPFSGSSSVLAAYIRGIGQSDFAFNLEPGVGVYVDDVYLARSIGANVDMLDVERIEVLKGPQGTLFGRNTIGGAIHVITRRPSDQLRIRAEVTAGAFERFDARGAADFPIVDGKLYSSVAFSSKNREGYQGRIRFPGFSPFVSDTFDQFLHADYQTADRAGGENQDNFRGKLLWVVNDDLELTFSLDYNHTDEEGTPNTILRFDPNSPPEISLTSLYNLCIMLPPGAIPPCADPRGTDPRFPTAGSPGESGAPFIVQPGLDNSVPRLPYTSAFMTDDFDVSYANGNNFNKLEATGFALNLSWALGNGMGLRYIGSVRELESLFGFDFDGSPLPMLEPSFDTYQAQYSHEVQLTNSTERLDWTLGAYFFHEDGDLTDYVTFPGGLLQIYGENYFDNDAWAVFAQLTFGLTERLDLTVGGRYTDEAKEFEGRQRDLNMIAPKSGAPAAIFPDPNDLTRYYPLGVNERDFDDFSGRFGLEYHLTDAIMAYVSYSEGFKSGGWTTRLSAPHQTTQPTPANPLGLEFDEETAESYELGLKTQLLDQRLQLNSALFTTDYENIQVTQQVGASPVFSNGGDGEISGFETELLWLLTDNFSLRGAVGWLDAEYTRIQEGVIRPDGSPLPLDAMFVNVPETSWSWGIDYDRPLASGASWGFHADWVHDDEIANDLGNTPELIQDETDFFHASVSFQSADNWRFVLGGRNLGDERHVVTGQNQPAAGLVNGTYNRPREWFATVRVDFE